MPEDRRDKVVAQGDQRGCAMWRAYVQRIAQRALDGEHAQNEETLRGDGEKGPRKRVQKGRHIGPRASSGRQRAPK